MLRDNLGYKSFYSAPAWQWILRNQISDPSQACCRLKTMYLSSKTFKHVPFLLLLSSQMIDIIIQFGNSTLPKRCPEPSEKIISEEDDSLS